MTTAIDLLERYPGLHHLFPTLDWVQICYELERRGLIDGTGRLLDEQGVAQLSAVGLLQAEPDDDKMAQIREYMRSSLGSQLGQPVKQSTLDNIRRTIEKEINRFGMEGNATLAIHPDRPGEVVVQLHVKVQETGQFNGVEVIIREEDMLK